MRTGLDCIEVLYALGLLPAGVLRLERAGRVSALDEE